MDDTHIVHKSRLLVCRNKIRMFFLKNNPKLLFLKNNPKLLFLKNNPGLLFLKKQYRQIRDRNILSRIKKTVRRIFSLNIEFGKSPNRTQNCSLIFFPCYSNTFCCGISALLAFKGYAATGCTTLESDISELEKWSSSIVASSCLKGDVPLDLLLSQIKKLKTELLFYELFADEGKKKQLAQIASTLSSTIEQESQTLQQHVASMVELEAGDVETALKRGEKLKDILWCISREILENIDRIAQLSVKPPDQLSCSEVSNFRRINAVLNSIDRLEVRGRDSAGVSLLFTLTKIEFENFKTELIRCGLGDQLALRTNKTVLTNNCITIHDTFKEVSDSNKEMNDSNFITSSNEGNAIHDISEGSAIHDTPEGSAIHDTPEGNNTIHYVSISIVYKYAAEIGSLGDNVAFIRTQIRNDQVLQVLTRFSAAFSTISAHTRWASVGDITQANCHPVDNESTDPAVKKSGVIHVSLNGDIDNYMTLKKEYESRFDTLPSDITTDTKIIPLQIEFYLKNGNPIEEAFRLAVNDFHGSHAISMHTDLAPGRLFMAQKGSGQAIFTGIAPDYYIVASELYGLVEETRTFIKLNGEKNGQILMLDQNSQGGVAGMQSMDYAGNPIEIRETDLQHSEITSRDIDRQNFPHYFLKEISEAPVSVSTTLQNKWKQLPDTGFYSMNLDRSVLPEVIENDLKHNRIKKIFFIGQGTAGIAAQGCADLFRHYLKTGGFDTLSIKGDKLDTRVMEGDGLNTRVMEGDELNTRVMEGDGLNTRVMEGDGLNTRVMEGDELNTRVMEREEFDIRAMKASELSGFSMIGDEENTDAMSSYLVVAISQSGSTTDTNRTVDMVRARGARTLAIVNRRDSDITFKTDGVLYTSSGRDIEMSVASTKAFYSQLTAGALLGLHIAAMTGSISPESLTHEINELNELPDKMRRILDMKDKIKKSARKHAITKYYWATVGSGSNKVSADEIRIKLSELCYKTISSDYVEDKKHIDLSSEPLIIICAAGTRESVLRDIIKDTAIFHAHKATPIVITDEGEDRFDDYAADVFRVPRVSEHFAPLVNTLVGHLWGYYAALSLNEGSEFIFNFQQDIKELISDYKRMGRDAYEVILENDFREKIASFYYEFTRLRREKKIPAILGINNATNITLLLKYLSGRLPVADFEIDFGRKGTPANMLDDFFKNLSKAINTMARPVDAIKHQAKTVTVGTSRIEEKDEIFDFTQQFEGVIFNEIAANDLSISQITNKNVLVIKNLQEVISRVKGALLYKISGLNLLGEPTSGIRIDVINKTGSLVHETSRVETGHQLRGTKNIILREGNVYIGKGRKDGRSILIIPVISAASDSSVIENLLSINVSFKRADQVSMLNKIKALGGKYIRIKDTILETDAVKWDDTLLNIISIEDLFGDSAEKIADTMISRKMEDII